MLTYNGNITEGVYTLSEFLTDCNRPVVNPKNADPMKEHLNSKQRGWMGLDGEAQGDETDFAATTRLVRDGWRKGVELMQEISREISLPAPRTIRRVQRWQDNGDELDMQSVWNGNLERAWRGTHRDYRSGPQRVRLLIDAIESGGEEAKAMRWKGVAALKLADALTEAGYSVQVESVISCVDSSNSSKTFRCRCIVKEYTQPVDLLTLAATTAMPAFFRSLVHAWGLAVSQHERYSVSYQVDTKLKTEMFKDEGDTAPAFIIHRTVKNAEKASDAVQDILKQIEGEGE